MTTIASRKSRKIPYSLVLRASTALVALMLGTTAWADDEQPAPSPPTPSGQIESITVTAQKRTEDLKDVPISVSVLGGAELADHHIEDYEDISRAAPGISFVSHGGTGQDNIEIRGVSSTVGSSTVGIYIDDVPIITANGYDGAVQPKLLDIDRVEVLRGPQGTLFGASSEGGTIRFITNQPDLDQFYTSATTDLSGTAHGAFNYDFQGVQNVPVEQGIFALRAAVEYGDQSGWIDNYGLDGHLVKSNVNDERNIVFRLTGKYQPSSDLTITPSIFAQRIKDADSPNFIPAVGTYDQNKLVEEPIRDTMFIPSLTVKKSFDFGDVTSVTSYFWRQDSRQADGTFFNSAAVAQFVLDPAFPQFQQQNDTILANLPSPVQFVDTFNTETQEIRFSSRPPSETGLPLSWVAGLYYSNQSWTHRDWEPIQGFSQAFQDIYGINVNDSILAVPDVPGQPNPWNNNVIWFVSDRNDVRQYAAFGQVDFDITSRLHGSAGMRYVYARESFTESGGGFFDAGNAGTNGTPYNQNARFYAPTPKFSARYDLDDTSSIYATIAKGFRLGGATTPNDNTVCLEGFKTLGIQNAPTTYGPDHLWSYEAGTKALLANRTLSVNADGYYIDWQQIQQTITIPICGGAFNTNAGNAQAYGGELEVRYKPPVLPGLTVGVNGGAEHAVITSTVNASTAAVGEKILNTPDWTLTALADYDFEISDKLSGFVRTDYDWVGRSHGSFLQTDPNFSNKQYGVLNASVGIDTGSMQVALYAKNLANDQTIIQRPQINSVIEAYTVRPLTIGLTVSKQF
jgi:outer membrane receptor protein involved in Fe transport